uniref:Uncharacterized protein n=1 Tax=Romanomermis culicivorax TaxID=13658 RepID=A0A915KKC9_ROMCU
MERSINEPSNQVINQQTTPLKVGLVAFIVLLCLLILIVGLYICYLLVQDTGGVQGAEAQLVEKIPMANEVTQGLMAETVQEVPFYSQDEKSQEPDRQERIKKERAGGERSGRNEQEEERTSSLQEQLTTLLNPKKQV